jgi:hypothetical protein
LQLPAVLGVADELGVGEELDRGVLRDVTASS